MNKSLEIFKTLKKDNVGIDHLVNIWIEEFFNTTVEQAYSKKEYKDSWDFYDDFQTTQKQHDWWVETVKPIFIKKFKLKGRQADTGWGFAYLDCAPKIKKEI